MAANLHARCFYHLTNKILCSQEYLSQNIPLTIITAFYPCSEHNLFITYKSEQFNILPTLVRGERNSMNMARVSPFTLIGKTGNLGLFGISLVWLEIEWDEFGWFLMETKWEELGWFVFFYLLLLFFI